MNEAAFRNRRRRDIVLVYLATVLVATTVELAAADTLVNTCGQTFSGTGFLGADLDCTGYSGIAVQVHGGTLDLQGHVLTGGTRSVVCDLPCEVTSTLPGGTIRNATDVAISDPDFDHPVALKVSNVTLDGNYLGILSRSKVVVDHVTITNTDTDAINSYRIRADFLTISAAAIGTSGRSVTIRDSTFTGAALGISAIDHLRMERTTITGSSAKGAESCGRMRIRDSDITDNPGIGLWEACPQFKLLNIADSDVSRNGEQGILCNGKLRVKNTSVSDNGLEGIRSSNSVRITKGSVVSGNGLDGVWSDIDSPFCPRVFVQDSVITGNSLDSSCGVARTCADFATCEAPSLDGSACNSSYDNNSGFPGTNWGICSAD